MTLTIEIPLPPVGCAQNSRKHRMAANRDVQAHREHARDAARQVRLAAGLGAPAFRSIVVTATWFMAPRAKDGRYRPLDGTNAQGALKAALDGLTDAGLTMDDDDAAVRQMPPTMLRRPEQHGGRAMVSLLVEGIGAGEITPEERAEWRRKQDEKALRAAGVPVSKKGGKKATPKGLFTADQLRPHGRKA